MSTALNPEPSYSVISTGSLINKIDKPVVIGNICKHFSIEEERAKKLLSPKVIIKKGLSIETANKYKKLFGKMGLLVVAVKSGVQANEKKESNKNDIKVPQSSQDFETLLDVEIPKVNVSLKYKLGLFLVICISTIAPLIYLGIIFGLFAGIVAYSRMLPAILSDVSGGLAKLALIVIPVFIPSVLLLFLAKPLFASHTVPRQYRLKRKQFPALFNLVEVMCHKIGVPVPAEICINNEVNASASATKGLISLARGKLKLTVGLPLIAGMSFRQFAGILAHEFGHFAQPSAMTTYYLINNINYWFASRAYEQDSWDERLEKWTDKADWHIVGTASILGAKFGIYITRKLFAALYLFNYKTTQFMSRHMEYDADAYESIFSGSDEFKNTAVQLRKLSYAEKNIMEINKNAWNDNKLLKNLPFAIAAMAGNFDESVDEFICEDMQKSETNAWDSHPADNDRINHVLKRQDAGILKDDYPAYKLCDDINTLCEQITLYSYRQYRIESPEKYVEDNDVILNIDKDKNKSHLALESFFNKSFYGRFIEFKPLQASENIPLSIEETINVLREGMAEYTGLNENYEQLVQKYSVMTMGEVYLSHSIELELHDFYLDSTYVDRVRIDINKVKESISRLEQQLKPTDQLFFHRLNYDAKLMNNEQLSLLKRKLKILNQIKGLSEQVFNLKYYTTVLDALLGNEAELLEQIETSINRYGKYCVQEANTLLAMSKYINYEEDGMAKLYDFIKTWCEDEQEHYDTYNPYISLNFSIKVLDAIKYRYFWTLAEICDLAVSVEADNNISPIRLVPM